VVSLFLFMPESVAYPDGARQRRRAEHFRFLDQYEAGLDQTLGQDEPVGTEGEPQKSKKL
jgi:hypothetical protein